MKKQENQRDSAFAYGVLDRCGWVTLAMTNEEGHPYCIPIQPVREGDILYFHCALEGEKTDCLRHHANVCLTAVARCEVLHGAFTTAYESAVVHGVAEEETAREEKYRALKLICEHYTPNHMERFEAVADRWMSATAVWKISMTHVTGKEYAKN